jgi:hypothetical protein
MTDVATPRGSSRLCSLDATHGAQHARGLCRRCYREKFSTAAPAVPSVCHPDTREHRRGLCRSCYRKLGEAGIVRPPTRAPGPPPLTASERLFAFARSLAPNTRAELAAVLEAVAA